MDAEEYQQELANLVETERNIRWRQGDLIQAATETLGAMVAYRGADTVPYFYIDWEA